MKTPLRTLTCALAAASALAAVPAGANPGPQRVTGGPGASALLKNGVLTMHWQGGSARIQVPPDYLLPAVTTRGELGGLSFDGRTAILALRAAGRGRALALPGRREGQADAAGLPRHGHVRRHRTARHGHLPHAARVGHGRDEVHRALMYSRAEKALNPVATKIVFSAEGPEKPERLDDAGAAAHAHDARPDGSWTYTLYNSREYPFIHALPLGQRRAGRPASSCRRPGATRASTLRLRTAPGHTLEVLSARATVLATADLVNWKLELSDAGF